MRRIMLILPLLAATSVGCGSKSGEAPSTSVGVPLSINNPSEKSSANAGGEKADVNKQIANKAVEDLVTKARAAAANRQFSVAIEALSQAIGFAPNDSRLFRLRGDVYTGMGENANARADYSLAIQVDPNNAELYNVRGYFLMTHGVAGASVADFDKAIKLNPKLKAAWNNRGLVWLASKEYDKAIDDFAKAIEVDRKYADAWNNRGFAQLKAGRHEKAIADLKQAVTINPDYATAWTNTGLVYMQQEDFANAVKAFSQAVRLAPLDVRWVTYRRAALLKLERFEEASADAQKIQWLNELSQLTQHASDRAGDSAAWILRAAHLAEGTEYAAAVQDYSRALQLDPGNIEALHGRAFAFLQAGDLKKAIADCDESLIMQPLANAFSIRGDAWYALKQFDQAISDFESARRFDSVVADAYRQRAAEHKAAGRNDEAQADLDKAEQIANGLDGKLGSGNDEKPVPFPEQ